MLSYGDVPRRYCELTDITYVSNVSFKYLPRTRIPYARLLYIYTWSGNARKIRNRCTRNVYELVMFSLFILCVINVCRVLHFIGKVYNTCSDTCRVAGYDAQYHAGVIVECMFCDPLRCMYLYGHTLTYERIRLCTLRVDCFCLFFAFVHSHTHNISPERLTVPRLGMLVNRCTTTVRRVQVIAFHFTACPTHGGYATCIIDQVIV